MARIYRGKRGRTACLLLAALKESNKELSAEGSPIPEAGGYFCCGIATTQSHEIPVCGFSLEACSIGMVAQETMKTKLDDQTLPTRASSVRNLSFDFS
jgi:hypothetical protein